VSSDEKKGVASATEESTGDVALDEKLSKPVFTFDSGFEQAQVWMCGFLIVAAGVMAYSNAFRIPFHADDLRWLCQNEAAHSLATAPQAVAVGSPSLLTFLDLAIDWKLAGEDPFLYRLSSLFLHLANGVLLFLVCRMLLGGSVAPAIPMLAGLLFALHPLATESVVMAIGRGCLLSAAFVLAGLLFFLHGTRDESNPRYSFVAFSCVCFALGAAAHTSALAFVLIVTAASLCAYPGRSKSTQAVSLFPCWFLFAVLLAAQWASSFSSLRMPDFSLACQTLLKIIIPINLSAAPAPVSASWVFLAAPLAVGIVVAAFKWLPGLAMTWMASALLAGTASTADPGERAAYLAIAGAALFVPWLVAVSRTPGIRAAFGIACAALVLSAGAGTYLRNFVWQDPVALWNHAAQLAPHSPVPMRKLGLTLLARANATENPEEAAGLLAHARDCLQQSLEKAPDDSAAREALGVVLMKSGETDAALEAFRAVLRADLTRRTSALSIAHMLFDRHAEHGNVDDLAASVDYFRHADALAPLTGADLTQYGLALSAKGHFEAAEPLLERATLGSDSERAEAPFKHARELARRVRGLMVQSAGVLAKNPRDPAGLRQRAQGLALGGQTMRAFYALDDLMHAQPPDYPLWLLMGLIRARMNATDGFLREWPNPPDPPEGAPPPWTELARTCAGSGLWDAAKIYALSKEAAPAIGGKPLIVLSEIALQFRQGQRAFDLLNEATKAYPDDPEAWLRLCDIATAGRDMTSARNYLNEAQARNADASELDKRRKAIGESGAATPAPGTIVQ